MGASCSSVDKAKGRAGECLSERQAAVATKPVLVKGHAAFSENYITKKKDKARFLLVKHQETQCDYACRVIQRSQVPCKDAEALTLHFQKLNGLEHPHICKFVETFEDAENYYMIYEKSDSTTLFKHIIEGTSFAEEDAAEYTRQITMALAVAHEQEVVHGRLSSSKVLILPHYQDALINDDEDDDEEMPAQVKICDYGQGLILRETALRQQERVEAGEAGDPGPSQELLEALPPEVAWKEVTDLPDGKMPPHTYKMDIWSLGVIVYYMLTGGPPHTAANTVDLLERIKTQPVEFGEDWKELTSDAREAVELMLNAYARLRPTASTLLKHPWLKMPRSKLPKTRLLRLLRNVRANASEGHFKRMVMRVIAQQLDENSRELNRIEQCFRFFDRNGDGVLSVPEICKVVRRLDLGSLGLESSDNDDLEEVVGLLDRDGSNTVNLQEFVAGALNPKLAVSPEKLWYAFNAFDRDASGAVSVEEIIAIVRQVEAGLLAKEQVDGLVHEIRLEIKRVIHESQDIDFEHFVHIMLTPTGINAAARQVVQRDMYRLAFNWCSVDCHEVRKHKPPAWNWQSMSHTAPSVYRRQNLASSRRKSRLLEAPPEIQVFPAKSGSKIFAAGSGSRAELEVEVEASQSQGSSEAKPARNRRGSQPGQAGKRPPVAS